MDDCRWRGSGCGVVWLAVCLSLRDEGADQCAHFSKSSWERRPVPLPHLQRSAVIMIHFTGTKINVNDLKGVKAPNWSPWQGLYCWQLVSAHARYRQKTSLNFDVTVHCEHNKSICSQTLSVVSEGRSLDLWVELFAFWNGSWNSQKQLVCKCQANL